jgi:hypothetical protein
MCKKVPLLRTCASQDRRWYKIGTGRNDEAAAMTEQERSDFEAELARLRQEHRDLDSAIEALQASPGKDVIQVQRLKKRKLVLRDRIGFIEDQLTPDIPA